MESEKIDLYGERCQIVMAKLNGLVPNIASIVKTIEGPDSKNYGPYEIAVENLLIKGLWYKSVEGFKVSEANEGHSILVAAEKEVPGMCEEVINENRKLSGVVYGFMRKGLKLPYSELNRLAAGEITLQAFDNMFKARIKLNGFEATKQEAETILQKYAPKVYKKVENMPESING